MAEKKEDWFASWFDTTYYHILYGERDYTEAEWFISNLVNYLKPSSKANFLDLACGRGRHAIYLNSKGFETAGVDLSSASIKVAHQSANETLHFDVHDMRKTYKKEAFDYVFNLFTSFGYFEDDTDNLKCIQAIANNLKPGGRLVMDFMNAKKVMLGLVAEEVKEAEGITFKINRSINSGHIIKQISFEDDEEPFHFEERVRALQLFDFQELFQKSGLSITDLFGDYELNPFNALVSDRLILVAEKLNT
ncbi:MAG: SAM-dependent methyltransferase [Flavobacteriales bacterium]|jgi:SAM-dependent methyltransferase